MPKKPKFVRKKDKKKKTAELGMNIRDKNTSNTEFKDWIIKYPVPKYDPDHLKGVMLKGETINQG